MRPICFFRPQDLLRGAVQLHFLPALEGHLSLLQLSQPLIRSLELQRCEGDTFHLAFEFSGPFNHHRLVFSTFSMLATTSMSSAWKDLDRHFAGAKISMKRVMSKGIRASEHFLSQPLHLARSSARKLLSSDIFSKCWRYIPYLSKIT